MARSTALAAAVLVLVPSALACTPRASQASLESRLVCLTCHTTLDESDSPFANQMKAEVARRVARCQSEREILDAMVVEFGTPVLSTPQTHGFDLLAWILPLGGIALGAVVIGFGAWRWSPPRTSAPDSEQAPPLAPQDERRVDDELGRFD